MRHVIAQPAFTASRPSRLGELPIQGGIQTQRGHPSFSLLFRVSVLMLLLQQSRKLHHGPASTSSTIHQQKTTKPRDCSLILTLAPVGKTSSDPLVIPRRGSCREQALSPQLYARILRHITHRKHCPRGIKRSSSFVPVYPESPPGRRSWHSSGICFPFVSATAIGTREGCNGGMGIAFASLHSTRFPSAGRAIANGRGKKGKNILLPAVQG